MAEIRKLRPIEYVPLVGVFDKVFDSDVAPPEHSDVYGVIEDGKIEAFVLAEQVIVIGQIWSRQPKKSTSFIKTLIKFVREKIPSNQTVAAVASDPRYEMLYRTLGLEKVDGTFFRRNAK
jgi:hypothetical protein